MIAVSAAAAAVAVAVVIVIEVVVVVIVVELFSLGACHTYIVIQQSSQGVISSKSRTIRQLTY